MTYVLIMTIEVYEATYVPIDVSVVVYTKDGDLYASEIYTAVTKAIKDFFNEYNRSFGESIYTSNLITAIETSHSSVRNVIMNAPLKYVISLNKNEFPILGNMTVTIKTGD